MTEIACFVSPHGYGHASRTLAVLEALERRCPAVHSHLFTTVPPELFAETLTNFSHHPVSVDVGLVQNSALAADISASIRRLDDFLPFPADLVERLAASCGHCALILCDIAPLGIAVAELSGRPSVLVENFTWDWIYQFYCEQYPPLARHVRYLKEWFDRATYRIQTEPLCRPAVRSLYCGPIFRRTRDDGQLVRQQLGLTSEKLVVITMGGVEEPLPAQTGLAEWPELHFLFTGQPTTERSAKNVTLLARDSAVYHPDLICAADLVVAKAGYSTVAECCQAGARVLAVGRADFPETAPLQDYLHRRLGAVPVSPEAYRTGSWLPLARDLLLHPRPRPTTDNGADRVAEFLASLLPRP